MKDRFYVGKEASGVQQCQYLIKNVNKPKEKNIYEQMQKATRKFQLMRELVIFQTIAQI